MKINVVPVGKAGAHVIDFIEDPPSEWEASDVHGDVTEQGVLLPQLTRTQALCLKIHAAAPTRLARGSESPEASTMKLRFVTRLPLSMWAPREEGRVIVRVTVIVDGVLFCTISSVGKIQPPRAFYHSCDDVSCTSRQETRAAATLRSALYGWGSGTATSLSLVSSPVDDRRGLGMTTSPLNGKVL